MTQPTTGTEFTVPDVFSTLSGVTDQPDVVEQWRKLALTTGASYFCTPDWVLAWWASFPGTGRAEVAVWSDGDGRVQAVVPLLTTRTRIHPRLPITTTTVTLLGTGAGSADHCGPVMKQDRTEEVRGWLAARSGRSPLVLANLDPSLVDLVPASARPVEHLPCPRVELPGQGELPTGSAKLRKQVRRYERRLADSGVTLRWVPAGQLTADVVDALLQLHNARMALGGRATAFGADRRSFHLRLLEAATPGRGPAAVIAEQVAKGAPGERGRIVGVLYGFRWRDEFAYYQTGWDPGLADLDLGTVLVATAMRECRREGVRVFDFLRGAEPYKYRFDATDRVDTTWLVASGLSGQVLRAKHWVKNRVRHPGKR